MLDLGGRLRTEHAYWDNQKKRADADNLTARGSMTEILKQECADSVFRVENFRELTNASKKEDIQWALSLASFTTLFRRLLPPPAPHSQEAAALPNYETEDYVERHDPAASPISVIDFTYDREGIPSSRLYIARPLVAKCFDVELSAQPPSQWFFGYGLYIEVYPLDSEIQAEMPKGRPLDAASTSRFVPYNGLVVESTMPPPALS